MYLGWAERKQERDGEVMMSLEAGDVGGRGSSSVVDGGGLVEPGRL